MRNDNTDNFGSFVNRKWHASNLSLSDFMHSFDGAFDFTEPKEIDGFGRKETYAAFHLVQDRNIATVYYWSGRNEWFVKY